MVPQPLAYLVFHKAAAIPRAPISLRRAAIDEQCLNVRNQGDVGRAFADQQEPYLTFIYLAQTHQASSLQARSPPGI